MRRRTPLLATFALTVAWPAFALAQEADTQVLETDTQVLDTDAQVTDTQVIESDTQAAEANAQQLEADVVPLESWTYDQIYAEGMSVDDLMGADVIGPDGEDIGDVENVLFDQDGRVLSIIAEVGGFLEFGDVHLNVPWEMVSAANWEEGIQIPIDEASVEDYSLFGREALADADAADEVVTEGNVTEVQQVSGDNAGVVETGPQIWRATDLIGSYARLRDGESMANYGYVNDVIVREGQIEAVLVSSDVGWGGARGLYGYPYGRGAWAPGTGYYDLPYDRTEAEGLAPFDRGQMTRTSVD